MHVVRDNGKTGKLRLGMRVGRASASDLRWVSATAAAGTAVRERLLGLAGVATGSRVGRHGIGASRTARNGDVAVTAGAVRFALDDRTIGPRLTRRIALSKGWRSGE